MRDIDQMGILIAGIANRLTVIIFCLFCLIGFEIVKIFSA
jgi:hypothetical protein